MMDKTISTQEYPDNEDTQEMPTSWNTKHRIGLESDWNEIQIPMCSENVL